MGGGAGFAEGGEVNGETLTKKRRPDRQWGDTEKSADNLPPAPVKKAKGGAMTRKPKKAKAPKISIAAKSPVPTPPPDYDDSAPPPAPGPAPMGIPPAGPPPMAKGGKVKAMRKGGECDEKMAKGGSAKLAKGGKAKLAKGGPLKLAAGGVGKVRKGFPNTKSKPKAFASGGKVRGCGVATKGCRFSGIY